KTCGWSASTMNVLSRACSAPSPKKVPIAERLCVPFSHSQLARHLNCAAAGAFSKASRAPSSAVTLTPLSTLSLVGMVVDIISVSCVVTRLMASIEDVVLTVISAIAFRRDVSAEHAVMPTRGASRVLRSEESLRYSNLHRDLSFNNRGQVARHRRVRLRRCLGNTVTDRRGKVVHGSASFVCTRAQSTMLSMVCSKNTASDCQSSRQLVTGRRGTAEL